MERRISELLSRMTLDEKIGQLNMVPGNSPPGEEDLAAGRIGSIIVADTAFAGNEKQTGVRRALLDHWQSIARAKSRLGIPVVFGRDIIHGYRTIAPIPLAQACSWDPEKVRKAARMQAAEGAEDGLHWTFAPAMDISRDARWGRVAESFGEDPCLASRLAVACVQGIQDSAGVTQRDRIPFAACAKHFVGYGAVEGGRDYDTAEISSATMHQVHLRPFLAAVESGCATLMCGFHECNGVPASADRHWMREWLKEKHGWDGCIVSDWGSIGDVVVHGFARDAGDAARICLEAGVDIDMGSSCYIDYLKEQVICGALDEKLLDEACARVLRLKFRLGLFDASTWDAPDQPSCILSLSHRNLARDLAVQSTVLLMNNGVLPLNSQTPLVLTGRKELLSDPAALIGCWAPDGRGEDAQSLVDGLGDVFQSVRSAEAEAESLASVKPGEMIVAILGELPSESGEGHSVASLDWDTEQAAMISALRACGYPFVAVVLSGRPLVLTSLAESADALLWAGPLGTETASALASLLTGATEPGGRLCMSMPRMTGQMPLYYGRRNGGKPPGSHPVFSAGYTDCPTGALYPFGYGMGYTVWELSDGQVDRSSLAPGERLLASIRLKNSGDRAGSTVVQCYLRDRVAAPARPAKELIDFQRVHLAAGESVRVQFEIDSFSLRYFDAEGNQRLEPGEFELWMGTDSEVSESHPFCLREERKQV